MRERDRIGGYVVRGDRAPMRCLRTAGLPGAGLFRDGAALLVGVECGRGLKGRPQLFKRPFFNAGYIAPRVL